MQTQQENMYHGRDTQYSAGLPAMIRRMAFLDRHKHAAAGVANLSAGDQLGLDGSAVVCGLDYSGSQGDRAIDRRRTKKLDVEFGSDCARRLILAVPFHQVIRRGPVRMAVE